MVSILNRQLKFCALIVGSVVLGKKWWLGSLLSKLTVGMSKNVGLSRELIRVRIRGQEGAWHNKREVKDGFPDSAFLGRIRRDGRAITEPL